MGWVFLEIAIALAIAALIVWWTMPRKRKGEPPRPGASGGPKEP